MARLNEPPVVGESIEALKRRFMRQNRELAKSNSELRIKVATLEADRSQLLSENITLRSENNHFKQEQIRDSAKRVIENVGKVKDKLVSKVAELAELMHELEIAHTKPPKPETESKITRRRSYKKSPTQIRQWRSGLCGPEMTGLAPIVEGKHFPRRTLGEADIQKLQPHVIAPADSPDISSPPITHFDPDEPIADDLTVPEPLTHEPEKENERNHEDQPTSLFANLETRRKRRTSGLMKDHADDIETKPGSIESNEETQLEHPLKSSAKRKFGLQEQENEESRSTKSDSSNFSFSRKSSNTTDKPASRQVKPLPERITSRIENLSKSASGESKPRRALGEKTVNTDPIVSPVKPRTINEKVNQTDLLARVKDRQRQKQTSQIESIKAIPSLEIPPTTPAALEHDLFSPTESITSADPERSEPLLSELTSKAAENTRPSRRQRAQVSYAEPSLRDKMRRPGKELADAVVIEKTVKGELQNKTESTEIPRWKASPTGHPTLSAQPTSPLQGKSSGTRDISLSPLIMDRRRKSVQSTSNIDTSDTKSDISRTVSAALVSSQKRLSKVREAEIQKVVENSNSEISVSDGSSPENAVQRDSASLNKHSRRHSSMSNIRMRGEIVAPRSRNDSKLSGEEILASGAERMASRRRSMQL